MFYTTISSKINAHPIIPNSFVLIISNYKENLHKPLHAKSNSVIKITSLQFLILAQNAFKA